ncbi:glycoside hydrolase family 99-like domain-containing protein [Bradyrhizobium sp. SSUT112]|uniref:glycosyltransferase WbsX family protein n=1 Tax=Bradyrhizobium sp. SSUT112 TaxID=3040604 RepID=UPI00244D16A0|nr:glycoside hydrolase family 99-like domain-containing protein [Bradyrhizobium sp. SSUT112]MDH2356820.1 glycoside hydrolase family 99-like domain-containing protein [Bradyrhizobium sp. SSUT112]
MKSIADQYDHNTSRSVDYVASSALPQTAPQNPAARYIAYYLPQFHAIPENDEWWGPGFTEWTNVSKALPRYVGHYQPRLPGELGFYDLSNITTLRKQAELAKRGGIYGFCIHNYWFSGKPILESPLKLLHENKDIDVRFCLNWANETWSRRWDGSESHILIKQNHAPGEDVQYAEYITPFVRDERYIRINGRPLIMLYRPGLLPDAKATVERWRSYFEKQGLGNPYIIMPQAFGDNDPRVYGMDAVAGFPPHHVAIGMRDIRRYLRYLDPRFAGRVGAYDQLVEQAIANTADGYTLMPGVCPQWDNDARRPNLSRSFTGSSPLKYAHWLEAASRQTMKAPTADERVVFINAWNEWAEGAYLEPDRHYGSAYLSQTRRVLDSLAAGDAPQHLNGHSHARSESANVLENPPVSRVNFLKNVPLLAGRKLRRKLKGH